MALDGRTVLDRRMALDGRMESKGKEGHDALWANDAARRGCGV